MARSGGRNPNEVEVQNQPAAAPATSLRRYDAQNSTTTPLTAATPRFEGAWTSTDGLGALSFVAIASHPLTTARLEWSSSPTGPAESDLIVNSEEPYHDSEQFIDGVYVYYPEPDTYLLRGYYRLVLENTGPTDQTFLTAALYVFPAGTMPWTFTDGTTEINALDKALLTRPVSAPVPLAVWTDATTGTLPSGPPVTIDPVLNTEPNVLDSGWIDVTAYAGKNILGALGNTAVKVYLMNASNAQGANIFGDLVPTLVTTPFFPSQLSAIFPDAFFRIVVCNDSGADLTDYRIRDLAAPDSTEGVSTSIGSAVFDFFPAQVTRSVTMGRQPDGTYINSPASGPAVDVDGNAVLTDTPLLAAGTYESGWVNSTGWDELELTITADQVSASDGILIEFTDDANTATPVARSSESFTFTASDVASGSLPIRIAPRLAGFRVRYTNGGFDQGTFSLRLTMRADPTALPRGPMESRVSDATQAVTTKGAVTGRDPVTGEWGTVSRTDLPAEGRSSLDVNVTGSGPVPIEPLTQWTSRNRTAVITASEATGSSPLPGRKTITVKANGSNNKDIFIGPTSAVNTSSARLVAGEGVTLDLDDTAEVWVLADTGTQAYSVIEIA